LPGGILPRWIYTFTISLVLLLALPSHLAAARGYEAVGYVVYAQFDISGNPTYKNVLLFDVKVGAKQWRIRTEPVIEDNKGIRIYEASGGTNDSVLSLSAFEPPSRPVQPLFQNLRSVLKETKKDDVYFSNAPPDLSIIEAIRSRRAGRSGASLSESVHTNRPANVAIAITRRGNYPMVDMSSIALLWFAFTPPSSEAVTGDKMLLQIWDDGNPTKNRFRRAAWSQFAEAPHLISAARYNWAGKELQPDGILTDIDTSDVDSPLAEAARYNAWSTTNLDDLVLPLDFKLTRFATRRSESNQTQVVSVATGSVFWLGCLPIGESLELNAQGKTFVTDYRLSSEGLRGMPLKYLINSNQPPDSRQLKQSRLYKRTLAMAKAATPSPYLRWCFLLCSVGAMVPLFILARGRNRLKGKREEFANQQVKQTNQQ